MEIPSKSSIVHSFMFILLGINWNISDLMIDKFMADWRKGYFCYLTGSAGKILTEKCLTPWKYLNFISSNTHFKLLSAWAVFCMISTINLRKIACLPTLLIYSIMTQYPYFIQPKIILMEQVLPLKFIALFVLILIFSPFLVDYFSVIWRRTKNTKHIAAGKNAVWVVKKFYAYKKKFLSMWENFYDAISSSANIVHNVQYKVVDER